jgi:hypothetical protein
MRTLTVGVWGIEAGSGAARGENDRENDRAMSEGEGGGAVGKLWRKHGGGYAVWAVILAWLVIRRERAYRKELRL